MCTFGELRWDRVDDARAGGPAPESAAVPVGLPGPARVAKFADDGRRHHRGSAERRRPPVRLPLPHALLEGPGDLRTDRADADRGRVGAARGLPLPPSLTREASRSGEGRTGGRDTDHPLPVRDALRVCKVLGECPLRDIQRGGIPPVRFLPFRPETYSASSGCPSITSDGTRTSRRRRPGFVVSRRPRVSPEGRRQR